MQELQKILEEIQRVGAIRFANFREPVITVGEAEKIIRAHISCENDPEIARSSRDTDFRRAIEILDKLSFFGGQRAGRELWNDKPREVQDEDIASFNRDIEWLRDFIRKHMNTGWIPVEERLPEEGTQVIVTTEDGMVYGDIVYGYADETDSDPCFHRWDDEYWQCFKPMVIAWHPLPEPYRPESKTEKPDWREDMLRKFDRRE